MNAFFLDRHNFAPFSIEHWLLFSAYTLVGFLLIYQCRKKADPQQYHRPITWFLGFITLLQLAKPFIRLHYGMFDIKDDLPFHLCNMLPLLMWVAIGSGSRFWFSVFSFWIVIGTTQSLITPTVTETFPHYESIRYWTVHFGLTFVALFGWIVLKWLPTYKLAFQSWLFFNAMALGMYFINLGLDSNYWYLRGKPTEDTALSMLWSWPYYLLQLEAIALLSFLALVAIIKRFNRN
ncbi:MAG TPA: TIGR02206 family membrane protein [Saprospiraceae bacterium]|jgi:hypothetical integral membrane protein (TIGR02206 family)|nr:TIGR02206 family membrane protein [Saprospiraceae bacterium]HRG64577.1 TIGR02206 family membrane protein [Saprospiraceae bacterium]